MSPALWGMIQAAARGDTDIPLAHLGTDGPSVHAALLAMGADEEEADDIVARGAW